MTSLVAGEVDPRLLAQSSPAGLAWYHGLDKKTLNSRYELPPHLALANRYVVDLVSGVLPELGYRGIILSMPPRHGKSELVSRYTPPWFLGRRPWAQVALASYEADFAASWGGKARDVLNDVGQDVFGVRVDQSTRAISNWRVLSPTLPAGEVPGGMLTAGVGGPLTGRGANLLIVDDPVKNMVEAHSETTRNKIWEWWQSTASTRLEPDGIVIVIATRWHEDDLSGRLLQAMVDGEGDRYLYVNLPALAVAGIPDPFGGDPLPDPLGREPGEPLWPTRWGVEEMERRRRANGSYVWNALYQGMPTDESGGFFQTDWLRQVSEPPGRVRRAVRFWDTAATEADGDWSVGVLMERLEGGRYHVADVVRGRWSEKTLEDEILRVANTDGKNVRVRIAQERGSAGKLVVDRYKRLLSGWNVRGHTETGDKALRARGLSAAAERGDVTIQRASWNGEYVSEMVSFPNGRWDDQVDASSGAHAELHRMGGGALVL